MKINEHLTSATDRKRERKHQMIKLINFLPNIHSSLQLIPKAYQYCKFY